MRRLETLGSEKLTDYSPETPHGASTSRPRPTVRLRLHSGAPTRSRLRLRCFWMIAARARNASLASPEVGNAAATSGSRTTTELPAAYRDAYGFGFALLKSLSGRISSPRLRLLASCLLGGLFIVLSLTPGGRPRTDDPNCLAAIHEHHGEQMLVSRNAQQHQTLLVRGMAWVRHNSAERIFKNGGCLPRTTLHVSTDSMRPSANPIRTLAPLAIILAACPVAFSWERAPSPGAIASRIRLG